MRFANPEYFYFLLALPAVIGFLIWSWQARQRALRKLASPQLLARLIPGVSLQRQVWKWSLFLLALCFMVLALSRPRFGVRMEMVERKGVDVIIALDISRSMLAQDIAPNRLDRARHEIGKFIDMLRGDRVGIIVFAGESYVQCPLTLDYGAARMFLDAINTNWIDLQGTAIAQAIDQSIAAFRSESRKHKVLVVLSDGEDFEGGALDAAKRASEKGVRIYSIGIGSESGVPIPVSQGTGTVVYKKDKSGNLVMTRLNPEILDRIARETGGSYQSAGVNLDLSSVYAEIAQLEKKDFGMNRMTVFEERYQIFLAIALALLVLEFFIAERVRRRSEWKGRFA